MTLWPARWLAVLALVGLVILLGLAASSEREPTDQEAQPADQGQDDGGGGGWQPSPPDRFGTPDGEIEIGGDKPDENRTLDLDTTSGEAVSFDIQGDEASVGIRIDGETITALPRPNDADGPVDQIPLAPDTAGDQAGWRLTPNGTLEPVATEEIGPHDLVIKPVPGGVDLIIPDGTPGGTHIEVRDTSQLGPDSPEADRPTGDSTIAVTEVAGDGSEESLLPDGDGQVVLDDGTTLQLPTPGGPTTVWQRVADTPWAWIVIGYGLLALASLGTALYLHLTRPRPFGPEFVSEDGIPTSQFGQFLDMLSADPDPARAVRLAFGAAEQGIGTVRARRPTETPFEWAERAGANRPDISRPLSSLCSLFATARFAPERPTATDRDQAVDDLRRLVEVSSYASDTSQLPQTEPVVTA